MAEQISPDTVFSYSTFNEDAISTSSGTSTLRDTSSLTSHTPLPSSSKDSTNATSKYATSEWSSFLNLLKANVGVGILAMPLTMSYTGLYLGLLAIPAIGLLCIYCMYLLLLSNRKIRDRLNCGPLNMEETNEFVFAFGPPPVRKFATPVTLITKVFLVINQIGFCCVYFEFTAQNIFQTINYFTGNSELTLLELNAILILPFIAVSLVRYFKFITYLSVVSSVAQVTGIAIILYYCTRDFKDPSALPAVGKWEDFPLFFGSTIFTFEGIGAVLPIENDMKDSTNFGGPNGVLLTVMVIVLCLYAGTGFFGYLQYGEEVLGSVSLNLPSDELLAQSVKIFLAVAIFLSYSIQLHVAVQVLMKMGSPDKDSEKKKKIKEYSIRISSVFLCFAMASAIPNLGLFISLVGAAGGSAIAIILPAIVNLVAFWPESGVPYFRLLQTFVIGAIGVAGFVVGTITSLDQIFDSFRNPSEGT